MEKRAFLKNAAILTVTSLILRTIGIFFRIYVSNRIGAEGMGLYQLIVSVYVLASTFASAGLTTAVTRLVADELVCGTARSVRRVVRTALLLSLLIGTLSTLLIYGGATGIAAYFLKDGRAASALRILSFSLPFMGVSSCIKGYFVARRRVADSSRAQILEQLVRIGVIVLQLERGGTLSVEAACFAILFGDTIAEGVSCLYMIGSYLLDRRRVQITARGQLTYEHGLLYRLTAIAAPITGGRYLNSGLRTIENVMVPDTLAAFTLSKETALSQFGKLKGMALPLLLFPSSFLTAFSTLLIPEISEAKALSQHRRVAHTVDRALHITLLSSVLISGLFWLLADPIGQLVYGDGEVGFMLAVLAPIAPLMYLEGVADGILKGLDQQLHSLLFGVLDSAVRILLIVLVVPSFGINGFLGVMVVSNLLTCVLNVRRLCHVATTKLQWGRWIVKPTLAMGAAALTARTIGRFPVIATLPTLAHVLLCGAIAAGLYLLLLPALGCITRDDLIRSRPLTVSKAG